MNFEWFNKEWLLITPCCLILVMAAAHFIEARKRSLCRIFSNQNLIHSEASRSHRFFIWLCYALTLTFICLSLAEPRYGIETREISHKGRDIVFLLDVSKSMLASDITPTRLKRAKADIADGVKQMQGHRLGLIAFAGVPKEVCPLTYDYFHFIRRLKDVSPDSVKKGGTNIGDAIGRALRLIEAGAKLGNYKDLILITDGQDLEGFYEEIAKKAGKLKTSIYTVGIGQSSKTSIRLADGTYLKSKGKIVETALNPEPLQLISQLSGGGFYQNLAANPNWLGNILKFINQKDTTERKMDHQERKIPRYHIFLCFAFIFCSIALLIPDRKRRIKS